MKKMNICFEFQNAAAYVTVLSLIGTLHNLRGVLMIWVAETQYSEVQIQYFTMIAEEE